MRNVLHAAGKTRVAINPSFDDMMSAMLYVDNFMLLY